MNAPGAVTRDRDADQRPILCVTIDCERDKGPRWRVRRPATFRGIHEGIGARLAPLFRQYGVKPTYLLSPEVMRDDAAATCMAALARGAELGTHLHAEYVGRISMKTRRARRFKPRSRQQSNTPRSKR